MFNETEFGILFNLLVGKGNSDLDSDYDEAVFDIVVALYDLAQIESNHVFLLLHPSRHVREFAKVIIGTNDK